MLILGSKSRHSCRGARTLQNYRSQNLEGEGVLCASKGQFQSEMHCPLSWARPARIGAVVIFKSTGGWLSIASGAIVPSIEGRYKIPIINDLAERSSSLYSPSKTVYARILPYGFGWNPASNPEGSE